jgi:hypothetical protein
MALNFDDFNYKNFNENLLNLEQKESEFVTEQNLLAENAEPESPKNIPPQREKFFSSDEVDNFKLTQKHDPFEELVGTR